MNQSETKRCIACAEEIQVAALLCRFCGTDQRDSMHWASSPKFPIAEIDTNTESLWVPGAYQNESKTGDPNSETQEFGEVEPKKKRRVSWLEFAGYVIVCLVILAISLNSLVPNFDFRNWLPQGQTISNSYSAQEACSELNSITQTYFKEFNAFRYSPDDGTGWEKLETLTLTATGNLSRVREKVRTGIEWDSTNVVNNLLISAGLSMNEIVDASINDYFEPGRDLETILFEISAILTSVTSSACKG